MHAGWKVFMQGFASGMLIMAAMVVVAKGDFYAGSFFATLWLILFWSGGRNAENLTERR